MAFLAEPEESRGESGSGGADASAGSADAGPDVSVDADVAEDSGDANDEGQGVTDGASGSAGDSAPGSRDASTDGSSGQGGNSQGADASADSAGPAGSGGTPHDARRGIVQRHGPRGSVGSWRARAHQGPARSASRGPAGPLRRPARSPRPPTPSSTRSFKKAIANADAALSMTPVSVMDKTKTPPSNDKHDYASLSTYWWPDPSKPDGLPYIRKDGQINPERDSTAYDFASITKLTAAVTSLGLGYYVTNDEKYAVQAAKLLGTWFLDQATRMNPNLNYSQEIPGVSAGRSEGVLDGMRMADMLDAVELLHGAAAWTPANEAALKGWFSQMLDWLRTSNNGQGEEAATNNHGTWYDVQATRYAFFVGRTDVACEILNQAPQRRIKVQIDPDGSLPLELARADPFHYELYDLKALFDLATLARGGNVDLWNYETSDGRGLAQGIRLHGPLRRSAEAVALPAKRHAGADRLHRATPAGCAGLRRSELRETLAVVLRNVFEVEPLAARISEVASATSVACALFVWLRQPSRQG